jgi:acetylornithine deacetylase
MSLAAELCAFLDERREELLGFLEELVATDSSIPPYADERAVVALLQDRLAELGNGAGKILARDQRRPNLIVRLKGNGSGSSLLLNGHVDTKPVGDALPLWHSPPLQPERRDGRLYGLGTSDMKGAVAAMAYAAAAIKHVGAALGGDLVLAFVADEEAGGAFGSKFVAGQPDARADACLVGEPSGWERDWQGLHLVSRGVCCFRIRVKGTQMHSSLSDRMPCVNASTKMADLMLRIADELELEFEPHPLGQDPPTLNVGVVVSGGVFFGVYPGQAEFGCDLRTLPGMTLESVQRSLDRWLDARRSHDPSLVVEVHFQEGLSWVPPSEIPPEHPLVRATQRAAELVLGASPPLSVFPGGTDSPWWDAVGIPTVPSFGPGILTYCHGPNEFIDLDAVVEASKMYALTAALYCA